MRKIANFLNTATDMEKEIFGFFANNSNPKDADFHAWTDKKGFDTHEAETTVYKILSSLINGGKSADFKGDYDPVQLEIGIAVEKEHTDNLTLREKISKDHLAENPKYYTDLCASGIVDEKEAMDIYNKKVLKNK
jgi:hypothetical protein